MILHKRRVLEALQGNARRQVRQFLRIKPRPKTHVLNQSVEFAVGRHAEICRQILELMPELKTQGLRGASVCEIGPGDCLATAALFSGLGAIHVTLVELEPPALTARQVRVLKQVEAQGCPLDLTILKDQKIPTLNTDRISYHQQLMEDFDAPPAHDFIFSYDVLEHVEDLPALFRTCARILKPGGKMLHVIDLGGHGQFEDPLPPLDFQTYSNWLYDLMFPPGHRATRRFVSDYTAAATAAGFTKVAARSQRNLERGEFEKIRPFLRPEALTRADEEVTIIEFVLTGAKP